MKASIASKQPADSASNSARRARTTRGDEPPWFNTLPNQQHPLDAGRPVGDCLRQIVEEAGQTVALLVWGSACCALQDRIPWIGWSATQRVERLKRVVRPVVFYSCMAQDPGKPPPAYSGQVSPTLSVRAW